MIRRRVAAIGVFLYASWSQPLLAQRSFEVSLIPNTEVRVRATALPGTIRGRAHRLAGDTLVMTPRGFAGTVTYRMGQLQTLEVRGGRDRNRGALYGAAILGGIGVVFGGIDYARGDLPLGEYAGTIVGNAAFGALTGYAFAPKGWIAVPLPRQP